MPREHLEIGSDGTDFSGVIVYRIKDERLQVLTIQYKKPGTRPTIKLPGGCASGEEEPYLTAMNEFIQETDLQLHIGKEEPGTDQLEKCLDNLVHVWTNKKVPDVHHQHFFAISADKVYGEARKVVMYDGDEELGVPQWLDAGNAWRCLFHTHRQALEKMIVILGGSLRPEYDQSLRRTASYDKALAKFLPER